MIVSYLRVSTKKQNIQRQKFLLDKLEIKFNKNYIDKISGRKKNRPQLNKMIFELKKGDIVYCESLSRLGRNLKDIINIIDQLKNKGIQVIIVKEGIDTNSNTYKLLLGIFGAIAEMERETIQERVLEGIENCKLTKTTKTGNWFGRKQKQKKDLPNNFKKYYNQLLDKKITKSEMSKLLGVGRSTIYRWIKIYTQN